MGVWKDKWISDINRSTDFDEAPWSFNGQAKIFWDTLKALTMKEKSDKLDFSKI